MKRLHTVRLLLLALLISIAPAASHAGVFVSVGFAPPPLPEYVQPECPDPGLMWMPGYWAYGPDGYYWVPGAWVPPPYEGALWTPGYWGWDAGFYMWHPGYWGQYVGYYGGVDYGFGYFGIGFVGGHWHDNYFEYNTAVMHIDRDRIHHFYEDRAIVNRYTVARGSRVSYNGGHGGINYRPSERERVAMRERHSGPTSYQTQHETQFRNDRNAYSRYNGGRPKQMVERQPLRGETRPMPRNTMQRPQQNRNMQQNQQRQQYQRPQQNRNMQQNQQRQQYQRPQQNRNMQQRPQQQRQQQQRQQQQRPQQQRPQQQRPQQQRPQQQRPQQQRPQRPQQQRPQRPQQQRPQQQRPQHPQQQRPQHPQHESKPAPRQDHQKPKEPKRPQEERR